MIVALKKIRICCALLLAVLVPDFCSAQYVINALPRWMTSIHLDCMWPTTPVDRFLDDAQWGYHFEFQYRLQYNKPFLAGVYWSEAGLSYYQFEYAFQDSSGYVNIDEKANTRRLETGLTAGFYPEINWLLQPYLQGRVGIAIFQSSSVIKDDDSGELIDRISEMSSTVPSYGLDVGIHIVPNLWFLRGDIRFGFVANPSASFMSLNEANKGTTGYPIDYFETHTSSGHWWKMSFGVSYLF